MFSIEQSLFLRALGQAIGHSLWQVAALWLAYAAISNVGKWNANRKYGLAAAASLAGFAWFAITLVKSYCTLPPLQTLTGVYVENSTEPQSNLPGYLLYIYHSTAISLRSLMPYISCAYLLLFVVLSIRLTNGFRQVKLFATQGLEKPNVEWRLFVEQHAVALGIIRKVKIFTSPYVQSPLTLGFWKPIILMPVASLANLTTAQIESILLHELAHIRRHDYLVNIFLQIAETSLFFNPFMRLLLKQVKQERENSCDDYVLQFSYSPKDYAKALLAVEHNKNPALLALAAKGNQSFQLLNRVRRMVAPQPKAFSYRQQLGLLLLLTVLTLGFTVIIPHPKKAATATKSTTASNKGTAVSTAKAPAAIASVFKANILVPPPPPAFDVVDAALTNLSGNENYNIDEAALETTTREFELKGKEIEAIGDAYGKEIETRMKPIAAQWEEWGKQVAAQYENGAMPDAAKQQALFSKMPSSELSVITTAFTKKMLPKLNALIKSIPAKAYADIARKAAAKSLQYQQKEAEKELVEAQKELTEQYAEDARQQIAQAKQDLENTKLQLQAQAQQLEQTKAMQTVIKQQMAAHKASLQKLHLGLFTDDRDTTLTGLSGLFAKLDKKHRWHASDWNKIQPDVQVNNQGGKCTITLPEIDFSLNSEDLDLPTNLNLDGQNINIRHDKQVKNGKEEKVVVISIK